VGEALRPAERARLFLQTKYTSVDGQDHRLPYDPDAPPAVQVGQSLAASLEHLRTDYVDALLLHGPSRPDRFTREDLEAWRAMAAEQGAGRTRRIGVSNVSLAHLRQLEAGGEPLPAIVQNRCFARSGWDHGVRSFCRDHGIVYQAFSLLTANGRELAAPAVSRIARRLGRTVPQVVFRFAMQAGMVPLTGTTDPLHMREDLACLEFSLPDEDVETLAGLGTG
jgi:diketogulonate reductase-like aldo/keto reductase